ncbi:FAD-dependent oxidoreductase [Bosea sp. BH3]|uniref:FAD-dependent oxidoreductase n=1 Tax=Bosea sp. BH3 TaxID=2871701 RepID=UPI0021CAEFF9|nr:FAD-dependent oxidoreductase [Bosea sp. BH3]MCU4179327.1 FAD-dependent oxidoreductase [Bosea sp. BH3]
MSEGTAKTAPPAALTPDICVIGAGANGIAVATAAAAFGVSVVLVERGETGGSRAPLAARTLIEAAALAQTMRKGGAPALPAPFHDHVRRVLSAEAIDTTEERLKALGIVIVRGTARFSSRSTVMVGDQAIKARRFVIATGGRPAAPDLPGLDSVSVLSEDDLAGLTRLPERPIVLGGDGMATALAQAMQRLGSTVSLVAPEGLMPEHDAEAVNITRRRLLREGLAIHEGHGPLRAERSRTGLRLVLSTPEGEKVVKGSQLFIAAPRRPEIGGLELDLAGIRHDATGILVDKSLRTANRRVYALGGCAGGVGAAASGQAGDDHVGLILRSILFRQPVRIDPASYPRIAPCQPEIAAIGLSEDAARAKAGTIRVLRWPFAEIAGARMAGEADGFIKLVTDAKGRLLGVTIVAEGAGELIAPWCVAVKAGIDAAAMAGIAMPALGRSQASRRVALSFHASTAASPRIRRLIGFLRRFG